MENKDWIKQELNKLNSNHISDQDIDEMIENRRRRFNGKLYKYCSFSDEDRNHSIGNLANDIIYFSKPETFNDPFDCYLGLSVNEVIAAALVPLFNEQINLSGENADLAKSMLQSLIFGDTCAINNEDNPTTKLIAFIFSQPQMLSLLKENKKGKQVLDDDFVQCFKSMLSNHDFVQELLTLMANTNSSINIGDELKKEGNLSKIVSSITKNPAALDLLVPESIKNPENISVFSALLDNTDILEKTKTIASITGHDTAKLEKEINKFRTLLKTQLPILKEKINQVIGITCFAERSDNVLMWSHYANKHTGFCVEYDFTKVKSKLFQTLLFPVIYSNKRPTLPMSIFNFSDIKNIDINVNPECDIDLIEALLTKSDRWFYEEEWRSIIALSSINEQCIQENCISQIYLGANISEKNEKRILEIAKQKAIKVKKYSVDYEQYKLELVDLQSFI